ncbi:MULTISPECIES: NUDIX hydrolase [Clostridium]|uniref:NUDIX hydrolase n=1 Tax=Clostridium disporicum TaxID=84024 RepID=A0A174D7N4_9CLOT|nr:MULTISPECIES: NUDIX hydrolase [Clostridium]MCD2500623.1 NUDIX hydrolase [Clostridium sp. NSJ-145]MDU6340096.1 NUDIX hydrolase [Clostridium sp.]CUO21544.1 NUDIX hydrolase [Clostridium disporicum]
MEFPMHIVAAGALVTNERGEVLLVKNPYRGWEFPGGQIENGEDLIEGVTREVFEESGIIIKVDNLVGVYSNTKSYLGWDNETIVPTKVIFDFLATAEGGALKCSEESVEVGWFEKDKVLNMITEPWLLDRAEDMLKFNGEIVYRVYSSRPYEIFRETKL